MFQQLQRKITFYIVLPAILLSTSVFVIFSSVMLHNLEEDFVHSHTSRVQQKIQLAEYYLNNVQTIASELAVNTSFIEKFKSPVYDFSITPILRYLKNASAGIAGVSAYSVYPGSINTPYHVSDFSSHPSLNELVENDEIASFLTSDHSYMLSIRTNQIATSYFNNVYDPKFGIITLLYKLHDSTDDLVGYLLIDLNPYYVHNEFFSEGDQDAYNEVETYIVGDEDTPLFVDSYSVAHHEWVNLTITTNELQTHDYLILSNSLFTERYRLVSLIPLQSLLMLKTQIILGMMILLLIVNLIVAVVAWQYAGKMTQPIIQLKTRMAHTTLK